MNKLVITVLGYDRPGIVASVSQALLEGRCNIEDVSQTILQTEFAGIFIVSVEGGGMVDHLKSSLERRLKPMGLSVFVKEMEEGLVSPPEPSDPFVITTLGPDRLGLVAGITRVLVKFSVNITNLKAIFRGGDDPRRNVMIYEVDIPVKADHKAFREALQASAQELGLEMTLQHRDIFEAIHRI